MWQNRKRRAVWRIWADALCEEEETLPALSMGWLLISMQRLLETSMRLSPDIPASVLPAVCSCLTREGCPNP